MRAASASPERDALLHGLTGWLAVFEANIVDSPEGRARMRGIVDAEAALFELKRMAALEHRWYVFSGLEMAAFVDAGQTVPKKGRIGFSDLNYSGGLGMRVRLQNAVVLRMDVARSREGVRWIWSLSDISRRRF